MFLSKTFIRQEMGKLILYLPYLYIQTAQSLHVHITFATEFTPSLQILNGLLFFFFFFSQQSHYLS